MKKTLLIIASALCLTVSAFAQDTFYPGFQWSLKGGASYTVGETNDFGKLVSPAAAIDLGWQFSRLFTLRADISGWEGKGVNASTDPANPYNWKVQYAQLAVDGKFDIINMFAKQYRRHVVNPYLFVGVGGQYRFNNTATAAMLPQDNLLNDFKKFSYVGRIGAGIDFQVCKDLAIVLEFVENATDDTFNSKKGDFFDNQMDLLLGLNFTFGQAKKIRNGEKAAAAQAAAAEAAAAKAAAEAAAAKAAADKAAAEKAAAEKLAAERAAAEAAAAAAAAKVAEEQAAYEAAKAAAVQDAVAAAKNANNNIYYLIGKSEAGKAEAAKISKLVAKLNANPDLNVSICGFADKSTGTPDRNMYLSESRAMNVYNALVGAGINPSRIKTFWYGDTKSVSSVPSRNRVAVMVSK